MNLIRHGVRQGGVVLAVLYAVVFSPVCLAQLPDFVELVRDNRAAVVNISARQQVRQRQFLPDGLGPGLDSIPNPQQAPGMGLPESQSGYQNGPPKPDPLGDDGESLGSGFIIGSDGIILTNNHVIAQAEEIIVRLADGRELEADLIGSDERTDLAVLEIDADSLPTITIGSGEDLEVGEWVLAIGSPFGFEHSVTAGIVSAKGRSLPAGNYVPYIQTDVAINPGNSGGPLFNLNGDVVGINSQIYSRTGGFLGLSFAIPIELAMDIAEQLQNSGEVKRGWLGVMIQDVTRELAAELGLDRPNGALVADVVADSPAAKAGMQSGDVILEFAGRSVGRSAHLTPVVGRSEVGSKVEVVILRDGETKTLAVEIAPLPSDGRVAAPNQEQGAEQRSKISELGIRAEPLQEEQRSRLNLGEGDGGVLVTEVTGPEAVEAGVKPGDILVTFDHRPVTSVKEFAALVEDAASGSSVPILVIRDAQPRFIALQMP